MDDKTRRVLERVEDMRIQRNEVERTMTGLRPSPENSPAMYAEWEESMGRLARMHAHIGDIKRILGEERAVLIAEAVHEVADLAFNYGGYADDSNEANRRSEKRDQLERGISKLVAEFSE